MSLKKAIGKIFILIALTAMAALAGLGTVALTLSVARPELISGGYIIHLAYRLGPLFAVFVFIGIFMGVFIYKDKRFFQ